MLSRREFGGGLAAGAAMHRRGAERLAPPLAPANEPNLARILRTKKLRVAALAGEEPYFHRDPKSGQWTGFCVAMGRDQVREGAHVLDLCADYTGADGVADMSELAFRSTRPPPCP